MELLSRSYVSMMLLFTILALPLSFLFFLALNFAFKLNIGIILLIAFLCTIITALGFYFYPASLIGGKNSKIKLEFPFALVHMSAVAGSGAQPISIFELIAESEDYPELKKEIKKIINYINLFGYDLTTALKNVANTTASPELKELLYGMVSTIETGGDLRGYLKEKAEDALNLYRLDRKKQIEALATYSEVYTSLLIAAPLLLLVTLAIINSIGGNIGGFEVKTLAWIGVAVALPLISIGLLLILIDLIFFFNFTKDFGSTKWYFSPIIVIALFAGSLFFIRDIIKEGARQKELEVKFLEFVRGLVENVRSGVTIPQAVLHVSNINFGALTPYVTKLANQIEWGYPLHEALTIFGLQVWLH